MKYRILYAGLIPMLSLTGCGIVPTSTSPTAEIIYQQTGIQITEAKEALQFVVPETGSVTVNIQASTEQADVYFEVYEGREADITVGDLVFWSDDEKDGQEVESYVLSAGTYTLFLQDRNAVDGAVFSILITQ